MYKYRLFLEEKEVGEIHVENPINKGEYVMTPDSMYRVYEVVHRFKSRTLIDGFETRLCVEVVLKK